MRNGPILALLSLGRHPVSGRARPAERDARALTLALAIADCTGSAVIGAHAGLPHDALRDYLGMGLSRLVVLEVADGGDCVAALTGFARAITPRLILAGSAAEAGGGTGLVPYLIAEKLGVALAPSVVAITPAGQGFNLTQALPRGERRSLAATAPIVATVDLQAPAPRQVARGPAMRGKIERQTTPTGALPAVTPIVVATRPARVRPKRIGPAAAGGATSTNRRLLVEPSPREAAEEILKFLEAERLLPKRASARAREPEETR